MARCLITGHMGYIGSHLYRDLQRQGHEVMGIDLKAGNNIIEYTGLKEDDHGAFHPCYWNFKPEYIFHLACIPRISYSVLNPVTTMNNNILCTSHVLNFARKVGAKRVIYSGSSSAKGNGLGPISPYGLQKLVSEMECKLYSDLYGLDTITLRYFSVYSEEQEADGPYATAISNWMHFIRTGKKPFITGDGEQRRDMAHISDVLNANIFAMQYQGRFGGRFFDIGTGHNISLNEIKQIVQKYHDVEFDYVEPRKGDALYTVANIKPFKQYGWEPEVDLYTGVDRCFNFK